MKFKMIDPGKIWAKSDHWFKSYGHFCHPIPALSWDLKVCQVRNNCSANFELTNLARTFDLEPELVIFYCQLQVQFNELSFFFFTLSTKTTTSSYFLLFFRHVEHWANGNNECFQGRIGNDSYEDITLKCLQNTNLFSQII